jgi:hypothetical protein
MDPKMIHRSVQKPAVNVDDARAFPTYPILSNLIQSYPTEKQISEVMNFRSPFHTLRLYAELFLRDALFAQATELTVRIRSWHTEWEARANVENHRFSLMIICPMARKDVCLFDSI